MAAIPSYKIRFVLLVVGTIAAVLSLLLGNEIVPPPRPGSRIRVRRRYRSHGFEGDEQRNRRWGDFDNDGYLDLFCYETGRLFRNINGKEFKEVKFPLRPMKVSIGAIDEDRGDPEPDPADPYTTI